MWGSFAVGHVFGLAYVENCRNGLSGIFNTVCNFQFYFSHC